MNMISKLSEQAKSDGVQKRVAGAIIFRNNELLLLKRLPTEFMPNLVELPSGNVEKEETIEQGLFRETKEETGLNVIKIKDFVNTFDYKSGSGKHARQFNFIVETSKKEDVKISPEEHSEYYWVDPIKTDLGKLGVSDHTKESINIALKMLKITK